MFSDKTPIWQLENREIEAATNAYGSLKDRRAAKHVRRGDELQVHIGPTAASKILFVLRPKALMPWDDAMRKTYNCDGSPESYFKYMVEIRGIALHVSNLCETKGFQIDDLPGKIGRPSSTVVELLNEYIWVTTRRVERRTFELPSSETLAHWASLG